MSFDSVLVQSRLQGSRTPWQVGFEPACGSTQDLARDAAAHGIRAGWVLVTDFQEAGRGRGGAPWIAPSGEALLFSTVLRPPPEVVPLAPLRAGIALVDGVRQATGIAADLKWPNDLLVDGRKLAGILIEHASSDAVLIGAGLNVNQDRAGLGGLRATSLRMILGHPVEREPLLASLLLTLEDWFSDSRPGTAVLAAWRERSTMLGRRIRYQGPHGHAEAIAEAILDDGTLQVRRPDGERAILVAGEVTEVRPAQS